MLKYLHTALERFAILGTTNKLNACFKTQPVSTKAKLSLFQQKLNSYARTRQTVMHVHRLAHVRNAIITTMNIIMMSYKLIQPAVNIGIGIGTADLMANVIVYLQYRQIVV